MELGMLGLPEEISNKIFLYLEHPLATIMKKHVLVDSWGGNPNNRALEFYDNSGCYYKSICMYLDEDEHESEMFERKILAYNMNFETSHEREYYIYYGHS